MNTVNINGRVVNLDQIERVIRSDHTGGLVFDCASGGGFSIDDSPAAREFWNWYNKRTLAQFHDTPEGDVSYAHEWLESPEPEPESDPDAAFYPLMVKCPRCNGAGGQDGADCENCDGLGYVPKSSNRALIDQAVKTATGNPEPESDPEPIPDFVIEALMHAKENSIIYLKRETVIKWLSSKSLHPAAKLAAKWLRNRRFAYEDALRAVGMFKE